MNLDDEGSDAIRIIGIDRFHQKVPVVSRYCETTKYETDRRAPASAAIRSVLKGPATRLANGLRFEIRSLDVHMRCHADGFAGFKSFCASDASLTVRVSGRNRLGQEISLQSSKETTEKVEALSCYTGMPAITESVDRALEMVLDDVRSSLSAQAP
ncbi:MAG: hypothetical protein JSR91_02230 [Proteobacteria bacterium]|nr:hypothetical protein [Pseudomonadota bacterium]